MNSLLFTDLHLTDSELEKYRWGVFKFARAFATQYKVDKIYCLGDTTDRKDRHSGVLVNKIIGAFKELQSSTGADIFILAGNHDAPLSGDYYWEFLNYVGINYVSCPTCLSGIWMLPFTPDPIKDWQGLNFNNNARALLMHQTLEGALIEGDRKLDSGQKLPILPRGVPIFSGDVHRPQKFGNITYIGTPHPVRFSESWANRMMIIQNDDWHRPLDIWIPGPKRAILDIGSIADLPTDLKQGDQCRVRYKLTAAKLTDWAMEEATIRQWAKDKGIYLASVEAILVGDKLKPDAQEQAGNLELMHPEEIIATYAASERLNQETTDMGLQLLQESKQ